MGFIRWLLGTAIIDPLIMLFVWNVLAVPMFRLGSTDFMTCFWISVVLNVVVGAFRLGKPNDDYGESYRDKYR